MSNTKPQRRIFLAGATGTVGSCLLELADAAGVAVVPHVRPARAASGHSAATHPHAAVCDLADKDALVAALSGCTTIIQTIGTMRKRFAAGDTYESSDIGTTRGLVAAARAAGGIDHVVLLSSVGAGRPVGAYLRAKAEAERIVLDSGIAYTIVRPSAFVGGPHRPPAFLDAGLGLLARVGGRGVADAFRSIRVEALARMLLHQARYRPALNETLEATSLWAAVEEATVS